MITTTRCRPCFNRWRVKKNQLQKAVAEGQWLNNPGEFVSRDSPSKVIAPRSWWAEPMPYAGCPYARFAAEAAIEFTERMRFNPHAQPKTTPNWGD